MISEKEVKHIALLARVELKREEVIKFQKELSAILDFFETLKEVDTSKVDYDFHLLKDYFLKSVELMREDIFEPKSQEIAKKLMELVPQKEGNYIKVKAVF